MEKRRLVILDGYSLLFRAFYGTRFLSTADGRPTNALFGFTNTLLALFNEHKPDALAVALDAPGKTFRHGDFPEYKGTRRETPPELISQLDYSRELIAALNLPCLEVAGYEADDVIGTVSKRGEEAGYEVLIVTGDRDSLQLVDPNVTVMMPGMRGADPSYYTPDAVREKYGFEPQQMVDYKALAGDASDNIPGVPGIGDKSATELVQKFGGVQGILERKQEVPEKFWKKIEPAVDSMLLSQRLATIDREAPVEYAFEPYRIDEGHVQRALAMLESLEFKSQAKRLQAALGRYMTDGATQVTEAAVHGEPIEARLAPGVLDAAALTKWVDGRRYSIVAAPGESQPSMFDQETPEGAFVAVGNEVRQTAMVDAMRLFEAAPARCLGHDVKPFYRRTSAGLEPPAFDAMIAGYVLQSGRASYELDDLVAGYLDSRPRTPAERAASLHPLAEAMEARLAAEGQTRVYAEVELALVPILAEMEGFGIAVDRGYLEQLSATLDASIEQARARVHELAGTEFNIGSPKQIGEVLFEKLQLPGGRKTKTGWATGVEVLSEIEHPVAAAILEYRELTKLKGTYADALPKMIGPDGRIHTSFNQTVAATGRLSSNEPNLQNIPIRTELGRQIRRAFVAAERYRLASFDYSQIELRVLAHVSHDPNLVRAFQEREDVHTVTAALMFKIERADVTKEQRRLAKLLNYAVLYGVTDFGLSQQLGPEFDVKAARELIELYNERFPTVKAFTTSIVEEARAKGFTATLIGRRRYFPDIHAANRGVRQYAERQAMNAPIQGTAADMIKMAMIRVRHSLGSAATRMLLQVHDELVFELAPDGDALLGPIRNDMESALPLDVPVEVDGKVGPNWLEMAPVT